MYYYPCKECENYGRCKKMMNMPMANMPMMNKPMDDMGMMPMMDMPMGNMPMDDMEMMNMPMGNEPMMDMPMGNMPMMDMPMGNEPMMDMPMGNMPMMNMANGMGDNDLMKLYPKIYFIINPMVEHHCNMMENMHGAMHRPSKDEMERMCKEICDKYDEHHKHDDDNCKDNDMRQRRRYGRRRGVSDLARILIIRNLIGRRRRHHRQYW